MKKSLSTMLSALFVIYILLCMYVCACIDMKLYARDKIRVPVFIYIVKSQITNFFRNIIKIIYIFKYLKSIICVYVSLHAYRHIITRLILEEHKKIK